jgi:hypothetical protein
VWDSRYRRCLVTGSLSSIPATMPPYLKTSPSRRPRVRRPPGLRLGGRCPEVR